MLLGGNLVGWVVNYYDNVILLSTANSWFCTTVVLVIDLMYILFEISPFLFPRIVHVHEGYNSCLLV